MAYKELVPNQTKPVFLNFWKNYNKSGKTFYYYLMRFTLHWKLLNQILLAIKEIYIKEIHFFKSNFK